MIKWDIDKEEARTIGLIVERATAIIENDQLPAYDTMDMNMDLTVAHLNGCQLDLNKLLTFKGPDFLHDIYGIRRSINRATGKVMEHFLPRCAK